MFNIKNKKNDDADITNMVFYVDGMPTYLGKLKYYFCELMHRKELRKMEEKLNKL
ncbi:hypothetical protein [Clostridium sp. JN-9]|uniref:hypothetical protein n=1 Tax=Clostridium sp. JN-9 TaxID=2507159 RepID=UPI0013E8BC67|nr:hypothetical protein [Clostridium sp. JN-9]